jgi:hypothetical protein
MRIVLELKRDANPALVTNHILKATPLQSSFAGNLLALTQEGRQVCARETHAHARARPRALSNRGTAPPRSSSRPCSHSCALTRASPSCAAALSLPPIRASPQPTRVSLREALTAFIAFRKQTTRARAQAARERAAARLHIAQGLGAALSAIDAVVVALRAAASTDEARAALCAGGPDAAAGSAAPIVPGGLSAEQADAILAMPLRRLTQLESGKLEAEAAELRAGARKRRRRRRRSPCGRQPAVGASSEAARVCCTGRLANAPARKARRAPARADSRARARCCARSNHPRLSPRARRSLPSVCCARLSLSLPFASLLFPSCPRAEIGRLSSLLADESVLTETLVAEQRDMRARFGSERRTRISSEARELSDSGAPLRGDCARRRADGRAGGRGRGVRTRARRCSRPPARAARPPGRRALVP